MRGKKSEYTHSWCEKRLHAETRVRIRVCSGQVRPRTWMRFSSWITVMNFLRSERSRPLVPLAEKQVDSPIIFRSQSVNLTTSAHCLVIKTSSFLIRPRITTLKRSLHIAMQHSTIVKITHWAIIKRVELVGLGLNTVDVSSRNIYEIAIDVQLVICTGNFGHWKYPRIKVNFFHFKCSRNCINLHLTLSSS